MTVVVVTEKNSAARNFAKALGGMAGTYQGTDYEIIALRGHLYEFAKPHEQVDETLAGRYKNWALENLPWNPAEIAWKRKPSKDSGISDILRTFAAKVRAADEVVCATDVDPTGEGGLLFAEPIVELGITPRKLTRMYFVDESEKSIQKAFASRREIVGGIENFDEYKKALTRAKFDWLTQQFTRVATTTAGQRSILRQGRLKSAMLLLVGQQLEQVNGYVKKPFFQNRFRDENGVVYTNPDEPTFDAENQVPPQYRPSAVVLDSRTDKSTAPPRLLDLAGLSSRLSSKGVKADVILKTYQRMYEDQVVSYPRTEDKHITTEQFKDMLPLVDRIAAATGVDPGLLTVRAPRKTHVKDSGAHGANRPGPNVPASLDEVGQKYGVTGRYIYEELARSFLAMFADDYRYEAQVGHLQDYPPFIGRVAVPKSLGWKQVFFEDKGGADDADSGESDKGLGTTADPFIFEGANKKPETPTMKWLMKQLEKRDVGTGATRTSTYAEVTKAQSAQNQYPLMTENRGKLALTEFGDMGYRLLPDTRIGDLSVTEYVYREMREVAEGRKSIDEVIGVVAAWVTQDIETMKRNADKMRSDLGLSTQVVQKERFEGDWLPQARVVRFAREWSGHRFTDDECKALLNGDEITITAISAKKKAAGAADPSFVCRGVLADLAYEGNRYVGFKVTGFGAVDANGREMPPKSWCGHTFSPDETSKLAAGEKIFCDDFVSKKNKTFAATVRFGQEDGRYKIIPEFG